MATEDTPQARRSDDTNLHMHLIMHRKAPATRYQLTFNFSTSRILAAV
jgi:hypothetical protein